MMKFLLKPLFFFVLAASVTVTARANEKIARQSSSINLAQLRNSLLEDITPATEWTVYKELSTLKIEYKFQECQNPQDEYFRNLNVVFFRFTNLTQKSIEVSWINEIYFDGECSNCSSEDSHNEAVKKLVLQPKETLTGTSDQRIEGLYIVANFIKLSPGMTGTKLTNFTFQEIEIRTIK